MVHWTFARWPLAMKDTWSVWSCEAPLYCGVRTQAQSLVAAGEPNPQVGSYKTILVSRCFKSSIKVKGDPP